MSVLAPSSCLLRTALARAVDLAKGPFEPVLRDGEGGELLPWDQRAEEAVMKFHGASPGATAHGYYSEALEMVLLDAVIGSCSPVCEAGDGPGFWWRKVPSVHGGIFYDRLDAKTHWSFAEIRTARVVRAESAVPRFLEIVSERTGYDAFLSFEDIADGTRILDGPAAEALLMLEMVEREREELRRRYFILNASRSA